MATNVQIGERLQAERQRLGMTQAALSQAAGVSKTTQVNYEAGKRSPDAYYLARVAAAGVDVLYVVTGARSATAMAADMVSIPMLDERSAGSVGGVAEDAPEYKVGAVCVSRTWLAQRHLVPANLRVAQVHGTSMQGVLADGDLVLVDRSDTTPRSGFVYVIRQAQELLVKYCELLPSGALRVSSANPAFQPYDVDLARAADFAVVGRVVASMHDW